LACASSLDDDHRFQVRHYEAPRGTPNVEITADGWFFAAQYDANLSAKCSDIAKAEKLRKRASDAMKDLSIFELTTLSSSD
jgi:hypothetical protein